MGPEISKSFAKIPLPQNSRQKVNLFEIILLLVVIGLFYWFVVSPKSAELSTASATLTKLQTDQKNVESQKAELSALIQKMQENKSDIEKLDEGLPFEGKITILNLLMEKFAADAGVNMENLSFSLSGDYIAAGDTQLLADPYKPKRSLKKISGNVSVQGDLGQIENFLQKLENSGRIFNISNAQITPSESGQMIISMNLDTYYFAP